MHKVKTCLNADLADTFGNLLNRCTSQRLNRKQHFPRFDMDHVRRILPESQEIIDVAGSLATNCYQAYLNGSFYLGISQVMEFLRLVNGLITATEPWSLGNSPSDQDRLDCILYVSMEAIRISAILLEPVIPRTAQSVLDKLNIDRELRTWKSVENSYGELPARRTNLSASKYMLFSKLR